MNSSKEINHLYPEVMTGHDRFIEGVDMTSTRDGKTVGKDPSHDLWVLKDGSVLDTGYFRESYDALPDGSLPEKGETTTTEGEVTTPTTTPENTATETITTPESAALATTITVDMYPSGVPTETTRPMPGVDYPATTPTVPEMPRELPPQDMK